MENTMKRFVLMIATLLTGALLAVAAPADGTWANTNSGQGAPVTLTLQVVGNSLLGTSDGIGISSGKVEGQSVWFSAVRGGVVYKYKGTINGNVLTLSETRTDGTGLRNLQFVHQ
jgi:hypothetical protein